MSFFRVDDGSLVPLRRMRAGAELYERDLEMLLWDNLEGFTGEPLLRLAKRPAPGADPIGTGRAGSAPDIVALDRQGGLVVLDVGRQLDLHRLAECLHHAEWARGLTLDEVAGLYHAGAAAFWREWMRFTGTDYPLRTRPNARVVLAARTVEDRAASALAFLADSGVPVALVRVELYENGPGEWFLEVDRTGVLVDPPNRLERPVRVGGGERPEWPVRGGGERSERVERPQRAERPGLPEHPERAERPGLSEHAERAERPGLSERPGLLERSGCPSVWGCPSRPSPARRYRRSASTAGRSWCPTRSRTPTAGAEAARHRRGAAPVVSPPRAG